MCLFHCIFLKLRKSISKSVIFLIPSCNLLLCFMKASHIVPLWIHSEPNSPVPVLQPVPHPSCSPLIRTAASQLHSPLMIIEQCLTVTSASALSTLGFIPSAPGDGLAWNFPGDTHWCFLCSFSSGRTFQCQEAKEALSTCRLSLLHAAVGCVFFIILLLK